MASPRFNPLLSFSRRVLFLFLSARLFILYFPPNLFLALIKFSSAPLGPNYCLTSLQTRTVLTQTRVQLMDSSSARELIYILRL